MQVQVQVQAQEQAQEPMDLLLWLRLCALMGWGCCSEACTGSGMGMGAAPRAGERLR